MECELFRMEFFATSHGKGAVDGVGAVVKRKVWQLVKAQNLILKNARDFHKLAKKKYKWRFPNLRW